MTLPIRAGTAREKIDAFCKRANRLCLSEVINHVEVTERLLTVGAARKRRFTVGLHLFRREQYEKEYLVTKEELLSALSHAFPSRLKAEISKELKKMGVALKGQASQIGKGKKQRAEEGATRMGDDDEEVERNGRGDDNDSGMSDVDVEDEKAAKRKTQQTSYDDDDSDARDSEVESDNEVVITAEDIEAAYNSDNLDGEDGPPAVKSRRKEKVQRLPEWAELLVEARRTFNKDGAPFLSTLNFQHTGDLASLEVEVRTFVDRLAIPTDWKSDPSLTLICPKFSWSALSKRHA